MLSNHFEAEPLIIARLKAANIADINKIASPTILSGEGEITKYLDAIFVMAGAGDYDATTLGTVTQTEIQYWTIVIAVKNIRDDDET